MIHRTSVHPIYLRDIDVTVTRAAVNHNHKTYGQFQGIFKVGYFCFHLKNEEGKMIMYVNVPYLVVIWI